ncbi:hypothetical protein HOY34_21810 [Xinfangfangia sp. D13-10-4-6]|nr:hypothetical protein [Pseudogemmobacter hezensis]
MFVVLLMMLHPTQELEPPANPVRFTMTPPRPLSQIQSLEGNVVKRLQGPFRIDIWVAIHVDVESDAVIQESDFDWQPKDLISYIGLEVEPSRSGICWELGKVRQPDDVLPGMTATADVILNFGKAIRACPEILFQQDRQLKGVVSHPELSRLRA